MSSYVSEELRRQVITRAERLGEYGLVHEDDIFFACQLDILLQG